VLGCGRGKDLVEQQTEFSQSLRLKYRRNTRRCEVRSVVRAMNRSWPCLIKNNFELLFFLTICDLNVHLNAQ